MARRASTALLPGWPGAAEPTTWPGPFCVCAGVDPSTTTWRRCSAPISRMATGAPGSGAFVGTVMPASPLVSLAALEISVRYEVSSWSWVCWTKSGSSA